MKEVQRQPFVAVVGASGSGKSSVVRAGLVSKCFEPAGGDLKLICHLVVRGRSYAVFRIREASERLGEPSPVAQPCFS